MPTRPQPPQPVRPLSPADLERIFRQAPVATAHADTAAEYARVVARLEALLASAGVAPDRVRAFRRAAAFARMQAVPAHERFDRDDATTP
jgi:hypothetical protein